MDWAEEVYNYIWQYVTENEALPSQQAVGKALELSRSEMAEAIAALRAQGRIEQRGVLPTAYRQWWRDYVRARWSYKTLRYT